MESTEAYNRRVSEGSRTLKIILKKFGCPFPSVHMTNMRPFTGVGASRYTEAEARWYQHIVDRSEDPEAAAEYLKKKLNLDHCFRCRFDFLRTMSAFVAVYADEVLKPSKGENLLIDHIKHFCSPEQVEWLFNFPRFKHCVGDQHPLPFLPLGTTANEAFRRSRVVNVEQLNSVQKMQRVFRYCIETLFWRGQWIYILIFHFCV